MQITIHGYLTLKPKIGKRQIHLEDHPPPTLQDLLYLLEVELDQPFNRLLSNSVGEKASRMFLLLLNGQHLSHLPAGMNTPLTDGDVLSIFPPLAGG
jgi:sulfur-carrier protein